MSVSVQTGSEGSYNPARRKSPTAVGRLVKFGPLEVARAQLRKEPLCRMCKEEWRNIAATVADHIFPHRSDQRLFWFGPLQSLCSHHHSGSKAFAEKRGYDRRISADGIPSRPAASGL